MSSIDEIKDARLNKLNILKEKGINFNVVACELNLKIVRRERLNETVLTDGDELEILQMIGGG